MKPPFTVPLHDTPDWSHNLQQRLKRIGPSIGTYILVWGLVEIGLTNWYDRFLNDIKFRTGL